MARKGGGFGFVMLLVVVVAALWLTARAWEKSGASALALDPSSSASTTGSPPARGQSDARDALGTLPDLGEMRDATSRHSDAVQEALVATEE